MTHTETQAMCERLRWIATHQSVNAGTFVPDVIALITRQQEEIDRLREAAKGSAVIVNVAKAEIDQRDLLLGEAKSILSLLVSDKTTSTSSQSIWAQCVSLECRIRAALQAKPDEGVNETFTLSDEAKP